MTDRKPRIGVSSCLPGQEVRHNGGHSRSRFLTFSRIGRELDHARRTDLADRIEAYRRGEDPLSVPIALLAHYASTGTMPWLAQQTYLSPFPAPLRLRHSVPR